MGSQVKRVRVAEAEGERRRKVFKAAIAHRFFVRFHMSLILSGVVLSGVTASKLLLMLGVRFMMVRYALAVLLAYGLFFVLVRLWIWYVLPKRRPQGSGDSLADFVFDAGTGGGRSSSSGGFPGFGGGRSGGGGASASWDAPHVQPAASMAMHPSTASGSSSGSSGGSSLALPGVDVSDLDWRLILVLVLFALLVAVVCGAGAYLIYAAPNILPEAAFQGALALGLRKPTRIIEDGGWGTSVLRSTWIPLLIVLVVASLLGFAAHHACPTASKLTEVFHCSAGGINTTN